ncbi:hypothetical protein [Serratia rhizosphaerae]|uniref:hypothetical protein n=1 Tax=Serratia rhizosphaerae TaxID=2597702 RepID=UPI001FE4366D|nr:hypothetical protein [Serratia rhizosphaerae]
MKKFTQKSKNRWRNRRGKKRVIYAIVLARKKNKKNLKVARAAPIPEWTVIDAVGNSPNL